ncbi:TPA: hypothetical protein HA231_01120 [Candidatus Woesearchaeota archaeon]|nr:hypothetical protein [Candidatus Woesearchaeota archaeon]
MAWFEELGFGENPFSTDVRVSARSSVGLDRQLSELGYLVGSGAFVFVEGAAGSGKSVLLELISLRLGRRCVRVDFSGGHADLRSVVRKRTSFLSRIFGSAPRGLVLLADNVRGVDLESLELLKYFYDNDVFGSVVLAGESFKVAGLSSAILGRIGSRVVRVVHPTEEEAVAIVRNRLGSSAILGDSAVRRIYSMARGDFRKFLRMCESACETAVASKSSSVAEEHLASLEEPLAKRGKGSAATG